MLAILNRIFVDFSLFDQVLKHAAGAADTSGDARVARKNKKLWFALSNFFDPHSKRIVNRGK